MCPNILYTIPTQSKIIWTYIVPLGQQAITGTIKMCIHNNGYQNTNGWVKGISHRQSPKALLWATFGGTLSNWDSSPKSRQVKQKLKVTAVQITNICKACIVSFRDESEVPVVDRWDGNWLLFN